MIDERDLNRAAEAIRADGVVVYPTETAYGLGVNATSENALKKLYALKQRAANKPTHIAVFDIEMANEYTIVDERARLLADHFLPGPLTLVLPSRRTLPRLLEEGASGTCGIRIPNHPIALELIRRANVPITTTSANSSGDTTPYTVSEVKESFGDAVADIDIVLDAGPLTHTPPSTLVSLVGAEPEILRQGPVSLADIMAVLE
ncbi:threonylcarbamoyl-AMP synthase [Candidatus Kaiserbacteria bacterium]|nr:threonylcarbamoyl-AMP synthase [Candidatus Kaiserbacteria bacterium]